MKRLFLGIDVGSVSTNIVLIDHDDPLQVKEALYLRTNGQPLEAVREGLAQLRQRGCCDSEVAGVGTTGSARTLVGHVVGADVVENEITAHGVGALALHPTVRTIVEIGGQDSKLIVIRDGIIVDFAMNTVCAAGTGSFLDQQACRLNIPIEEFGAHARRARAPVRIAGRCTVFAESDMVHKQQLGVALPDILAGLCEALVRNYLNNVAKGRPLEEPLLFQGGVAHNVAIREALERELRLPVIVPRYFHVMGAIGAAVLACEQTRASRRPSRFRGLELAESLLSVRAHPCQDCENRCEVMVAFRDGQRLAAWGDRCGTWSAGGCQRRRAS